jgi:hypothetical protein
MGQSPKLLRFPEMGRRILSNCFGTSLWLLGFYDSEWPMHVDCLEAGSLFLDNYSLCEEERGCLVAFVNFNIDFSDTEPFEHSGVYFPFDNKRLMIHQPDIKQCFKIESIREYCKANSELEVEFYCPVEKE